MKISLLWIGKTKDTRLSALIDEYVKRLGHYGRIFMTELADITRHSGDKKEKEAELFLSRIEKSDFVVLLDEKGKKVNSRELAVFIERQMISSTKRVMFIIAGAEGSARRLKERADLILSLSPLTFTHDMARLILTEQLYRAFTIIRGEKYHNS